MINGDMSIDDVCQHKASANSERVVIPSSERSSIFSSISILLLLACGDDPNYVSNYFQCGIIEGLLICFGCFLITQLAFYLFIRTWVTGSDASYSNLWIHAFGDSFYWVPIVFQIIAYGSISLQYVSSIQYDFQMAVLSHFDSVPSFLSSKWTFNYVIAFLTAVPILFFRTIYGTRFYAYIQSFCLCIDAICIVVLFAKSIIENGFNPGDTIVLWCNDLSAAITCFNGFNLAFFIQPLIPRVMAEMKRPTKNRVLAASWGVSGANMFFLCCGGILGYINLTSSVGEDNLLEYYDQSDIFVSIGYASCLIIDICASAEYIYVIAIDLCSLSQTDGEKDALSRVFAGIIVIFFSSIVNFSSDVFLQYSSLMGDISYVVLSFVIPCAIYLKMYRFTSVLWGSLASLSIFIFIPIAAGQLCIDMGWL